MGYSGDQMPKKRRYDSKGNLIEPEDTLLDDIHNLMCNNTVVGCLRCKHLYEDKVSCKAFPNNIPSEILSGEVKHDTPYEGDNGIRFESKEN